MRTKLKWVVPASVAAVLLAAYLVWPGRGIAGLEVVRCNVAEFQANAAKAKEKVKGKAVEVNDWVERIGADAVYLTGDYGGGKTVCRFANPHDLVQLEPNVYATVRGRPHRFDGDTLTLTDCVLVSVYDKKKRGGH